MSWVEPSDPEMLPIPAGIPYTRHMLRDGTNRYPREDQNAQP